jgi:hypothetical protein
MAQDRHAHGHMGDEKNRTPAIQAGEGTPHLPLKLKQRTGWHPGEQLPPISARLAGSFNKEDKDMKTIQVQAFEFDELSDAAKERARESYRRASEGDDFWSECVIDETVQQGELMGITFKERARTSMSGKPLPGAPCIWWRGFSSQGDGACFEGTWRACDVKADKVADGWGDSPETTEIKRIAAEFDRIAKKYPEASFSVTHRGHYSHENCTEFDFSVAGDEETQISDGEIEGAEESLKEAAKDFMRYIYRALEKEYEHQNSDEAVDENISANEYLFTEEGRRSTVL